MKISIHSICHRLTASCSLSLASLLLLFTCCTSTSLARPTDLDDHLSPATAPEQVQDQGILEAYNRNVSGFNRGFDKTLLKPAATFYKTVTPPPVRDGVLNFFSNLNEIPTFFNDILQGHFSQACGDFWRFTINSTVGIGGLIDVAGHTGLPPHEEDFGLTMAHWGYTNSAFFVLPFLGPSTIRDAIGLPINYYLLSPWPYIKPHPVRYTMVAANAVSKRASLLEYNSVFKNASLNPYVFERNAYLQRRQFLIEENGAADEPFVDSANPADDAPGWDMDRITDDYKQTSPTHP